MSEPLSPVHSDRLSEQKESRCIGCGAAWGSNPYCPGSDSNVHTFVAGRDWHTPDCPATQNFYSILYARCACGYRGKSRV